MINCRHVWIGLHYDEGKWQFTDGTSPDYMPVELESHPKYHQCGKMSDTLQLVSCGDRYAFICEFINGDGKGLHLCFLLASIDLIRIDLRFENLTFCTTKQANYVY